jgi:prepilin-type N-terminal cleavage/methylation domain-containing protein
MRVHSAGRRPAVTLIELLVVIAIVAGLAALAVVVFPRLRDSQRVNRGADTLQGQLFLAKNIALRDQQPRGVRLVLDTDGQVHSVQLIEQPPPYVAGVITGVMPSPVNATQFVASFAGADFSGGAVQIGDFLDLSLVNDTSPAMHLIVGVGPAPGQLLLASLPVGVSYATTYRIVRGPRAMIGTSPVLLPRGVVIDTPLSSTHPNGALPTAPIDAATGQVDVLFSPSGKVLGTAGAQGKVIFWVWDSSGNQMDGDQTLVAVYTRTGAVIAQPVNVNPAAGDAYQFVKDARTSGM